MIGFAIGSYFVSLILDNIEFLKHLAWVYGLAGDFRKEWTGEIVLIWFPLGLSIGVSQWIKLRHFGVNPLVWSFLTAIGFAILAILFSWVSSLGSFEYRMKYDIPYWVINTGLVATFPIGGVIIGSLQSLAINRHFSKQGGLWVRAYTFGLLMPAIFAPIAFWIKSFVIKTLYSVGLYNLVEIRWVIFFGFLFLVTFISTSILTGDILLKQINNSSITIKAG
jgi:hypothetical protein